MTGLVHALSLVLHHDAGRRLRLRVQHTILATCCTSTASRDFYRGARTAGAEAGESSISLAEGRSSNKKLTSFLPGRSSPPTCKHSKATQNNKLPLRQGSVKHATFARDPSHFALNLSTLERSRRTKYRRRDQSNKERSFKSKREAKARLPERRETTDAAELIIAASQLACASST